MLSDAQRAITLLAVLLLLLFARVAAAAAPLRPLPPQPPGVPWPEAEWPTDSLAGVDRAMLEQELSLVAAVHPLLGETRAVVIIEGGRLVVERYMPGFGPDTPLISWSMAKSVTHALVGIAMRRGLLAIDRPMGSPRWSASDPRAAIPWRYWLNMIDGQDYHEIGVVDHSRNDAARMLFGVDVLKARQGPG